MFWFGLRLPHIFWMLQAKSLLNSKLTRNLNFDEFGLGDSDVAELYIYIYSLHKRTDRLLWMGCWEISKHLRICVEGGKKGSQLITLKSWLSHGSIREATFSFESRLYRCGPYVCWFYGQHFTVREYLGQPWHEEVKWLEVHRNQWM